MNEEMMKSTFILLIQALVDECKFIQHLHEIGIDTTRGEFQKFGAESWNKAEKLGEALKLPLFCNDDYHTITWWLESVWLGSEEGCKGSYITDDGEKVDYTIKSPEDLWEIVKQEIGKKEN